MELRNCDWPALFGRWYGNAKRFRFVQRKTEPSRGSMIPRAAGSLDCGRRPAAFCRQPCCRMRAWHSPIPSRFRVGRADWFDASLLDIAPAGLAGKSGSRAAAVQGADAPSRAVGSLDCGRRPAAFWRQASCRVTRFTLPNAEPLSRLPC